MTKSSGSKLTAESTETVVKDRCQHFMFRKGETGC